MFLFKIKLMRSGLLNDHYFWQVYAVTEKNELTVWGDFFFDLLLTYINLFSFKLALNIFENKFCLCFF